MNKLTLTVRRGASADIPIRVESDVLSYATITAIAQSAPVRITAASHGIPDGWRAAVMNAKGMTEINAENNPPKDSELRKVTVVDANTVEFNKVNSAGFRAYVSGGQLAFYTPRDLSAYSAARMDVKTKVGGEALASYHTDDGTLELDPVNEALWLRLTAAQTGAFVARSYVFDIELVRPSGAVEAICSADSVFVVLPEVTTTE